MHCMIVQCWDSIMKAHSVLYAVPGKSALSRESDGVVGKEQFKDVGSDSVRIGFDPNGDCHNDHAKPFQTDGSPSMSSASDRWDKLNCVRSGFQRSGIFQTKNSRSSENLSIKEEEDAVSVRGGSNSEANNETQQFPYKELEDGKPLISVQKAYPLYALRRNPKPSRRFTDQEFDIDIAAAVRLSAFTAKKIDSASPARAGACPQTGKVFVSPKTLFGHMRCHPERDWRRIQRPDNTEELEREANCTVEVMHMQRPAVDQFFQNSRIQRELDSESNIDRGDQAMPYETPRRGDVGINKGKEKVRSNKKSGESLIHTEKDDASDKERVERRWLSKQATTGGASKKSEGTLSGNERDTSSIAGIYQKWYHTGKRSKRSRHTVQPLHISTYQHPEIESIATEIKEERDMADCLVMLACGGRRLEDRRTRTYSEEESAFSDCPTDNIAELELPTGVDDFEEETVRWTANSTEVARRALTAAGEDGLREDLDKQYRWKGLHQMDGGVTGLKYECSTCKRYFKSHQALGGHRASHKKVKGCFGRPRSCEESAREDAKDKKLHLKSEKLQQLKRVLRDHKPSGLQAQAVKSTGRDTVPRKLKGHECFICHRVFASGQALGGHKRCHWTGEKIIADTSVASSSNKVHPRGREIESGVVVKEDFLDLNLPSPLHEEGDRDVDRCAPAYCDSFCNVSEGEAETKERVDCREGFVPLNNDYWRREEAIQLAGGRGYSFCVLEGEAETDGRDFMENDAAARDGQWKGRLEETVCGEEEEAEGKGGSGQKVLQLNWFVHCDICDNSFTSIEALSNHVKVHHTSLMSPSVAGLTPISA